MKNVVVTGDEVGIGVIGHRELLHGTRLDQLLRESKEAGPMLVMKVLLKVLNGHTDPGAHPCSRPLKQDAPPQAPLQCLCQCMQQALCYRKVPELQTAL